MRKVDLTLTIVGVLIGVTSALLLLIPQAGLDRRYVQGFALFGVVGFYLGVVGLWLRSKSGADRVHEVKTASGHTALLHEYAVKAPQTRIGVVWCTPGIYSNASIFDVDAKHSLARYLVGAGFDVFCMDLSVANRRHPFSVFKRWFSDYRRTYADFALEEYPAAAKMICELTGVEKIGFVGHSMGGMLYYAYAGTDDGRSRLSAAVTIGSMGTLGTVHPTLSWLAWGVQAPLLTIPTMPARQAAQYLLAPYSSLLGLFAGHFIVTKNVDYATAGRHFFNNVNNHPNRLLGSFAEIMRSRSSVDLAYRDRPSGLGSITTPTMVVAGSGDHIARRDYVRYAFDKITAPKKWRLMGTESGDKHEHGHNDMVFSDAAQAELWPEIAEWLRQHSATQTGTT